MSEEEKIESDNVTYGEVVAFDDNGSIVKGEKRGWVFHRGKSGLFNVKHFRHPTRGWKWMGSGNETPHWRILDKEPNESNFIKSTLDKRNGTPVAGQFTQYYWMGPPPLGPLPWPASPRTRTYEFFVLNDSGSGFPTWKSADLGEHTDIVKEHNRNVAAMVGGKRRKTRRRRRQSKRFSKTKK